MAAVDILDSMLNRQLVRLEKLKRLSQEKVARGKEVTKNFTLPRQTTLLRPHDQFDADWYFCVPPYFNDALDIRLIERVQVKDKKVVRRYLEWSQGSSFSFSEGDIVYDTPTIEGEPWREQIKRIGIALQVLKGSKADLIGEGDDARRFAGHVECVVLSPDESHERLEERGVVSMSQDDFVRILISGPNETIQELSGTKTKFDAQGQGLLF